MMDPPCTWTDLPLCAWAAGIFDKPSSMGLHRETFKQIAISAT
jgi:hypothetical protein